MPSNRVLAGPMRLKEFVARMQEGQVPPPPIMEALGMRLLRYGEGWAEVELMADGRFHNLTGTVHGAIATGLADTAMGIAVAGLLNDDERFTTIELKINFLRPVVSGKLIAEGRVLYRGKRTAYAEATVTNEEGKLVAKATSTCMVFR